MIKLEQRYVCGTRQQVVGHAIVPAGTWEFDCILGSKGAVGAPTLLVRAVGGATLATLAPAAAFPVRQSTVSFSVAVQTEIEFVLSSSTATSGVEWDAPRIRKRALQRFSNNVRVAVGVQLNPAAVTLTVGTGLGAQLPAISAGEFFMLTLVRTDNANLEVVRCTARVGDVLTVVRGQEGTSGAQTWPVGESFAEMRATAGSYDELRIQA